ncbi:nickel pincer cofactor-dependent isomerase, group 22 [Pelosinus propionicus]|uniref:LarA-like N-terminal domain-containing protein n=1 Tax=Pelosinus propionicus DSM 13327 TaxID=1123291 RepID=A0A1I4PVZ0_9FIRM|nr:lactate racemase domain-containing protein [Pelosinus propionicus]SFM31746.1 protein of unknown function [Pelosinus propionicus DSM 13327]
MPILLEEDLKMQLPRMIKVRQKFEDEHISNIEEAIRQELKQDKIKSLIKPGQSIAVAVGSRGINHLSKIVKETVNYLKELGALPFIVPAMGSHGGATANGQLEVLHGYGVTEQAMGVPIKSSMDVVLLGFTPDAIPVYVDNYALAADMVVLINRVKPHTGFRGPIESGICKMMAIGLGKHVGCSRLHQVERADFSSALVSVAEVFLEKANFGFGLALVENAFDQTAFVKALVKDELLKEEQELLIKAKALLPALLLRKIDVLLVEQIGKNISGPGMDPNIIGRHSAFGDVAGYVGPKIERIVVLDLSKGTHGNATGIGTADFITKTAFDKIDFTATYANQIAARNPAGGRIPITMETEREALIAAIKCCRNIDENGPCIVRIKDTLHLSEIWLSENMLPFIAGNSLLEIME